MSRRTAVFHIGRCGSTVLRGMLDATPGLVTDGEVFSVSFPPLRAQDPGLTAHAFAAARFAQRQARMQPGGHYVFEVKFFSTLDPAKTGLDLVALVAMLQGLGVDGAVVLRRANSLRRLVSTLIAVQRGDYHLRPGQALALPQVKLLPKAVHLGAFFELRALLQQIDDEYQQLDGVLAGAGLPVCHIGYEADFQADPRVAYAKVCDFLEVAPARVDPPLQRINDRPLSEVIENYTQVSDHLVGTRFEWMLTAP